MTETEKAIGAIYQDLESKESYIFIVTSYKVYKFDPVLLFNILDKYAHKSCLYSEIGVPYDFGLTESTWKVK